MLTPTRRFVAAAIVLSLIAPLAAVGSRKVEYVGGTIAGLSESTEGNLDTTHPDHLRFQPQKKGQPAVEVPYASVTSLEYGQKAGRRVAVGILITPWALFSKKRKHFLTVSFNDRDGREQAMVLELGKDIIRTTLTVVETRSGHAIEYQDEEARKHGRGGN
jgi:hypothetical protein